MEITKATFGNTWATFLIQHLVTLPCTYLLQQPIVVRLRRPILVRASSESNLLPPSREKRPEEDYHQLIFLAQLTYEA